MKPQQQRRNGYTLVELTIAGALTVFLAVVISSTWRAFSRPASSLIAWSQLFQEMDLAVATLARDLGGSLPEYTGADPATPLGGKADGRLIMCQAVHGTEDHLQLWYSSGTVTHDGWLLPAADGTMVAYCVDGDHHTLVRSVYTPPTATVASRSYTVAGNVYSMTLDDADANTITMTLTFKYPRYTEKNETQPLSRTCRLVIQKRP